MNPKRIALTVGFVTVGSLSFFAGVLVGESRALKQGWKGCLSWLVPESVHEYQVLETGDVQRAKTICGQRIWSLTDAYYRDFSNGIETAYFMKSLPEAHRIITVVSNGQWQRLFGDLDPGTRRIMMQATPKEWHYLFDTNATKLAQPEQCHLTADKF